MHTGVMQTFKIGKSALVALVFSFFFLNLISCGPVEPKGNIILKDLNTDDFDNLTLSGNFRAFYVNADSSFVSVETYENVADNLKINVKNQTLSIKEKRPTKKVDFYNITIYSKYQIKEIEIDKMVELNISSEIKTDQFRLNAKNNAKFIGSLRSRVAEIVMSEKSRVNLRGQTQHAKLKISDTASIIAPYWEIDRASLDAGKNSYTELNVKDSLRGTVKNTAQLVYYQQPVQALKIERSATVHQRILE